MPLFGSNKKRMERYLKKYNTIKTIVVCGSYGRKSAIRALGYVLGEDLKITMGINKNFVEDAIVLDYNSGNEFPDIDPDILIITACETDEEAQRYFALANRSQYVLLDFNDVPQEYAKYLQNPNVITYGNEFPADYYFENEWMTVEGCTGNIVNPEREKIHVGHLKVIGEYNLRPLIMAAAVAKLFQIPRDRIKEGLKSYIPLHGRMSPARGLRGSIIIDDSASSSKTSVKYGLQAIYGLDANVRILVAKDVSKLQKVNYDLMSEVLVMGEKPENLKVNSKVKFFADEIEILDYLTPRLETDAIVLLEIPLPELIQSYIW